jgi:signal transduction histidine kinase
VYDYLLKPCDENELLLRVKRALEMQTFGSEQKRLNELSAIAKTSVTLSDRINTPLNIILGNIEILQLIPDLENQTKVQETLKVMETQIFRIKKVMDRLAKLTNAETKRYPALRDFEIIDLTSEDGDD